MEGQNWLDAGEALADVADMARLYDADGIDIYFLNNQRSLLDVRVSTSVFPWLRSFMYLQSRAAVRGLFQEVLPDGRHCPVSCSSMSI